MIAPSCQRSEKNGETNLSNGALRHFSIYLVGLLPVRSFVLRFRRGGVGLLLFQNQSDVHRVLGAVIPDEPELRPDPEIQAVGEFRADEAGRGFQSLPDPFVGTEDGIEDLRLPDAFQRPLKSHR